MTMSAFSATALSWVAITTVRSPSARPRRRLPI
jgi:hypothetical protein